MALGVPVWQGRVRLFRQVAAAGRPGALAVAGCPLGAQGSVLVFENLDP